MDRDGVGPAARPATGMARLVVGDLHRLRGIERESFANPWAPDEFARVLEDPDALCLGAWHDGGLVAYAIGQVVDGEFHLASLAVAASARRRGWGGALLRQVLAAARDRGCRWCRLEVRASNEAAARLYSREGFVDVARWRSHYSRPTEDALVMEMNLEDRA